MLKIVIPQMESDFQGFARCLANAGFTEEALRQGLLYIPTKNTTYLLSQWCYLQETISSVVCSSFVVICFLARSILLKKLNFCLFFKSFHVRRVWWAERMPRLSL